MRFFTVASQTKSERLFEAFCREQGLDYRRLEPDGEARSPDYEVALPTRSLIAEIKQFNANAEERRLERQLETRGYTDVYGTRPGDRVRRKISQADPQLKSLCRGVRPGIVVLFNNVGVTNRHTAPYNIKTGMYGIEAIDLAFDPGTGTGPLVVERRFGPNRKMSPGMNTTVSAVAVLREDWPPREDRPTIALDVFHNIFARVPLDPEELRGRLVRHFTLDEKVRGRFQDWVEL